VKCRLVVSPFPSVNLFSSCSYRKHFTLAFCRHRPSFCQLCVSQCAHLPIISVSAFPSPKHNPDNTGTYYMLMLSCCHLHAVTCHHSCARRQCHISDTVTNFHPGGLGSPATHDMERAANRSSPSIGGAENAWRYVHPQTPSLLVLNQAR
jgi:hypothetical protein